MKIPRDYEERVYAGVLGKVIGVYLGQPFEGWRYERIMAELGEIWYYVHEQLGRRLVVTDDDITGTFTFLRALPDYGNSRDLTPAQIGQTWLNYCIEGRTVHWWGGRGNSTCHTVFIHLLDGMQAPSTGSAQLNGKVMSEQICSQIFIDGWAMVAPGDPELAVELARRAASVSHDGEAIYAAQVLTAMESLAFVESDTQTLLDTAVSFIPKTSDIYRMIDELRDLREGEDDWHAARRWFNARWGYGPMPGNIPIQTNHGLIILALLYGDDDFQKSLMIVNTCGCDTDCNSGNVGCLMGIKNGLRGIDATVDFRGPVEDRLYLVSADGGRAITDAVSETYHVVNVGRALAGLAPCAPKGGARFHFELPGSVQCFRTEESIESHGAAIVENVVGHSRLGERALALRYQHLARSRFARVATATFIPPEAIDMPHYGIVASPTLYSGQNVRAAVLADEANGDPVRCRLYIRTYGAGDELVRTYGPETVLVPGGAHELGWRVPDTGGQPIAEIGLELASDTRVDGTVYVDYLTWDGAPSVVLRRPETGGTMWRRAWVDGIDLYEGRWPEAYRLAQNRGTGLLIQGTREWTDYSVCADVAVYLVKSAGIAARVQGMRRYYALLLCDDGKARLVKALDGNTVLGEADAPWQFGDTRKLCLEVVGARIRAWVDGKLLLEFDDSERPLMGGAVALVCEEGRMNAEAVVVEPAV